MTWTNTDLTKIETAIATGELSVQFADRRVQYRSIAELLQARDVIKNAITTAGGESGSVRSTNVKFTKD